MHYRPLSWFRKTIFIQIIVQGGMPRKILGISVALKEDWFEIIWVSI